MTKIYILLLFLVPLFSPFSFGITQPKHSVNILSIIKDWGFTGVWKNEKEHIKRSKTKPTSTGMSSAQKSHSADYINGKDMQAIIVEFNEY